MSVRDARSRRSRRPLFLPHPAPNSADTKDSPNALRTSTARLIQPINNPATAAGGKSVNRSRNHQPPRANKPLATTTPIVTLVQVGTPDLVEVEMEEDPRYGINVICSISPANQILADPAVLPDLLIRKLA